jgi:hypothetical protein
VSRTRKGSKGPGWEPWSNRLDKAEQKANYKEPESSNDDDICPGCPKCKCVKCGGWIAVRLQDMGEWPYTEAKKHLRCVWCGHKPDDGDC